MEQTTTESPVTQVPHAIDAACTKYLHDHAYACLYELHNDYFSAKTFEDSCKEHLGHTAVISKILAYRFFSTEIFKEFLKRLEPHAKKVLIQAILFFTLFFIFALRFPNSL